MSDETIPRTTSADVYRAALEWCEAEVDRLRRDLVRTERARSAAQADADLWGQRARALGWRDWPMPPA